MTVCMENGLKAQGSFDHACPSGVSYSEHILGLPLSMVQVYWRAGGTGIFVFHPMLASMLVVVDPSRFSFSFENGMDWPVRIGCVGGIHAWADPSIRADEVLVVEEPGSLQAHGRLRITNFVEVPNVLDRMAVIDR